jgi:hypothetical protein
MRLAWRESDPPPKNWPSPSTRCPQCSQTSMAAPLGTGRAYRVESTSAFPFGCSWLRCRSPEVPTGSRTRSSSLSAQTNSQLDSLTPRTSVKAEVRGAFCWARKFNPSLHLPAGKRYRVALIKSPKRPLLLGRQPTHTEHGGEVSPSWVMRHAKSACKRPCRTASATSLV